MEIITTRVKDVMNPTPHTIAATDSLRKAAEQMRLYECGALPVLNDKTLVGMITDRDIVIYGIADGCNPDTTTVQELMSEDVVTCSSDTSLEMAADMMGEHDIRRLVVTTPDNEVTGVVSIADIIKCTDQDAVNDNVLHHLFRYA